MSTSTRTALCAGVGPVITHYELLLADCGLVRRGEFRLPNNIQYACAHSEQPVLYVGTSTTIVGTSARVSVGSNASDDHSACALRIGEDGALSTHGPVIKLPHRPVHVTLDGSNRHLLAAFNKPAGLAVIDIREDGSLGGIIEQRADVDLGCFPHQLRITPDNRYCISVDRGNPTTMGWWAAKGPQREPGSLNVFSYDDGHLGDRTAVTVGDGYWFGPRHLDFHPNGQWIYLSVETENEAVVFARDAATGICREPLQTLQLLEDRDEILVRQGAGAVHVHPRGHVVYFCNRGHFGIPERDGKEILRGDLIENSFVVYAIDSETGLLTEVQRIDSGGICARTFSIDPTGRTLVAANAETHWVKSGDTVERVPANLSTFEILDDGQLRPRQRYDLDLPFNYLDPSRQITWSGFVAF